VRPLYRRTAAAGAAVLLVGAAATTARAQGGDDAARYRLATATLGDVEQTMPLNGTVEHANRSDVGFGTSGTVAKVYVAAGEHVRAGQRLAALDTSALGAAVTEAKANLAQAKAQLETDQNAQDQVVQDATQQTTAPKQQQQQPKQPQQPTKPDPALQQALKSLAAQQQAVRDAQTATTAAINAAKDALAKQQVACAVNDEHPGPTEDCATALAAVQTAQDAVAATQDSLQAAIATLTDTLTKAIAALGNQGSTKGTAARALESVVVPAVALDTSTNNSQASNSAGSIASDQAAIDQAEVDLLTAQHQLAAAVLTAPKAGTVAATSVRPGASLAAGDTALTIIGKGATTVVASSTVERLRSLKVGQKATVTVPGIDRPLTGRVTSIALLPTTGDSGSTYPVTITLSGGGSIPTGSTANAAVVVSTAKHVVTVPASAVSKGTVRVMEGKRAVTRKVTVGAVGTTTIQVTGIEAGTRVVLADRDAALPSQQSTGGPGGLGGFGEGPRSGFSGPGGPTFSLVP
jgi:HlyD family secretion protein